MAVFQRIWRAATTTEASFRFRGEAEHQTRATAGEKQWKEQQKQSECLNSQVHSLHASEGVEISCLVSKSSEASTMLVTMQDWNPWHEAIKASYSLIVSIITLGLGWLVGQALTFRWNIRQKRRELQLSATQQFYGAYGEFFAVWKLWNRLDPNSESLHERQWELHNRAAAAEAVIEGTLVKLSSELALDDRQLAILGRFRQAFQQLRQSIRTGRLLGWTHAEHPEYKAFKVLAVGVAALLAANWPDRPPTSERAASQLLQITSNTWEDTWVAPRLSTK